MAEIKTVFYTPEWEAPLLDFVVREYPNRSADYFRWWISNMNQGGEALWAKTPLLVEYGEGCAPQIVGCTLTNDAPLYCEGAPLEGAYYNGNLIVDETYRGRGLARSMYNARIGQRWVGIGVTDMGAAAIRRYCPEWHLFNPSFVYLFPTLHILTHTEKCEIFPDLISKAHATAEKVHTVDELDIPATGLWGGEKYEYLRSREFIQKRFFDIYRASEYVTYRLNGKGTGYFVVRKTRYKGVNMLALVDFRCAEAADERAMLRICHRLARLNRLAAVIALTSRQWGAFTLCPPMLKMRKTLTSLTAMADLESKPLLITSADNDLDFVYYK